MRAPTTLPLVLFGCTWIATATFACGGPAEPASSASDAPATSAGNETSATAADPAPKWDSTSSAATATPASGASTAAGAGAPTTGMGTMPMAHRTDVYDKEATEIALKRAAIQVKKNCGQAKNSDGKAVGPWGTTQVQVTLGHNGHTKGATVSPPFEGTPGGKCVLQAFASLSFSPWDGPDTTIPWDVELVQPSK